MSLGTPPEAPSDAVAELIQLIERRTGIALIEGQIHRRVLPLIHAGAADAGEPDLSRYARRLQHASSKGPDWVRLVDSLTNGQTAFFRDPEQIDALGMFLRARVRGAPVQIWSAACSTGEEPYSLAISTLELGVECSILATDINGRFLAHARAGRYEPWPLRRVSSERIDRWFHPAEDGGAAGPIRRVREQVRERVRFQHHNLVTDPPPRSEHPDGRWDLVVCRNVFLYFTRDRVSDVCHRLIRALADDGRLVIAASESLQGLELPLEPEQLGARMLHRHAREPRRNAASRWHTEDAPAAEEVARRTPGEHATRATTVQANVEGQVGAVGNGASDVRVQLERGHLALERHALDDALEAFTRAVARDGLLPEAHFFRGLVLRKQRRWREAADALRRALFLAPGFWQAAYLLSGTYGRLRLHREAARERARTRLLLQESSHTHVFLSPPEMVARHTVDEGALRREFGIDPPHPT